MTSFMMMYVVLRRARCSCHVMHSLFCQSTIFFYLFCSLYGCLGHMTTSNACDHHQQQAYITSYMVCNHVTITVAPCYISWMCRLNFNYRLPVSISWMSLTASFCLLTSFFFFQYRVCPPGFTVHLSRCPCQ